MTEQKKPVKHEDKKPDAEAAGPKIVAPMPPLPQAAGLRMIVIETNGTRAEVRPGCTMQGQELLNILNEVAQMVRQAINNSPPLHPPAPAPMPVPPAAEA